MMVKPAAFLPNKDGETSVIRHNGHPPDDLWQIGIDHVVGERPLYGAALFMTRHVRDALLDVVAQEPPHRHANINKWPCLPMDPEMEKARRKEVAALLAQNAELLKRQ